jgi:hypothetical protein
MAALPRFDGGARRGQTGNRKQEKKRNSFMVAVELILISAEKSVNLPGQLLLILSTKALMNVTDGSFAIDEKRGGHGLDVCARDELLRSIPHYWKGSRHTLEKFAHLRRPSRRR